MFRRILTATVVAGSLAVSAPAMAQAQAGLVNVNISNLLNNVTIKDILSHNNVNVQVPANVNLPIGLAANVCGVSVLSLKTDATCTAKSDITQGNATAVAQAILRQAPAPAAAQ
jgi:hypothetical protein